MTIDVFTPWPTSGFFAMIVMTPSGVILMNELGDSEAAGPGCASSSPTPSRCTASIMPPPARAETRRKLRRETVKVDMTYSSPRPAWVVVLVAVSAAARLTASRMRR